MKKRGQALVEFIIILPFLIMILFGAVDFGRIIIKKNELESITSYVVDLYEDGKSFEEIEEYLRENDETNSLKVTNKDNKYIEFTLEGKVNFVTPGLGKILGDPYKTSVKRVIYYE